MADEYDPVKYKLSSMQNWNTVARGYHSDWASKNRGPFKSTSELVKAARIKSGDSVLDVACGTGAVSTKVVQIIGSSGMLVGIDFSRGALEIARSSVPTGHFLEMDAESIGLDMKFDKIVCQYALMFFPDPARVLRRLCSLLKNRGRFAIVVHGTPGRVPYFSTIMEPLLDHIPDIRPKGTPTVHRFGKAADLQGVIADAGFSHISIKEFTFYYDAGNFGKYWSDYMSTTAHSIRAEIEANGPKIVSAIRRAAKKKAQQYMTDGRLCFPWQVLIATAVLTQD